MAGSALETSLEELLPGEVLAELRAQVQASAGTLIPAPDPARSAYQRWQIWDFDDGGQQVEVDYAPRDERARALAALRSAMATLGVGDMIGPLTDATLACATAGSGGAGEAGDGGEPAEAGAADPSISAPAVLARSRQLLGVIESVNKVSKQLDGVLVAATRDLTAARAQLILAEKQQDTPEGMSQTQVDRWRRAAKSQTRHELEAALGWFPSEVQDLVGLAMSPAATLGPVLHSLRQGESTWQQVRKFFRDSGGLPHEDSARIANALFGDDPSASVTERLDSTGHWIDGPWRAAEFRRALAREIAHVNAADAQSRQAARDQARANQDLRAVMDDSTADLMIGCSPLQAAAIADRVEKAAKAARRAGAPETLRELRAAIAIALLMHGTLDTTTLPDDPDLITVEQSAELQMVLNGLPAAQIDVVVPFDTLIGHRSASPNAPVEGPLQQNASPQQEATPSIGHSVSIQDAEGGALSCLDAIPLPHVRGGALPRPDAIPVPNVGGGAMPVAGHFGCVPAGFPSAGSAFSAGAAVASATPERPGVGEVIGRQGTFLMPEEAQLLAMLPGSTLHRLLIDPATGRCVERSISAYPFDSRMRAQLIASDRFCRAPGCLRPARASQMDHVIEHGTPGGHTCEANGQSVCEPHHDQKTKKAWDAALGANRDLTWTTMLGRIYRTKAFDYRQYSKLVTAATTQVQEALAQGEDRYDVINAAVYQALSYREPGQALDPDELDDMYDGWGTIGLSHLTEYGQKAYGPDPEIRQAEIERHLATRPGARADARDEAVSTADDEAESTGNAEAESTGNGEAESTGNGEAECTGNAEADTPWTDPNDEPPPF